MDEVAIMGDSIKLVQLLKLANLVGSGADVKALLAESVVRVNGEIETRRGRQLVRGDVVSLREATVRVSGV